MSLVDAIAFVKDAVTFLNGNSGVLNLAFSALVAISTVVYAMLTWRLVSETRRMREVQTEPKIDVLLSPRDEWINFIEIEVRNIGQGPAYDVKFSVSPHLKNPAHEEILNVLSGLNFLKQGIRYLSPKRELRSFLVNMAGSTDGMATAKFTVNVSYKSQLNKAYEDTFVLDFEELSGMSQLGEPPAHKIADKMERIERHISQIASGFSRIKVETIDQQQLQQERESFAQQAREFSQRNANASSDAAAKEVDGSSTPSTATRN